MAKLDELGRRENTTVLYSSDHGDMLGSQGERLKRKLWEESIHVPGFLRWPGRVQPNPRSDVFFTHAWRYNGTPPLEDGARLYKHQTF